MAIGDKNAGLLKRRQNHVPESLYNITPYFVATAKGATIKSLDGRELIDFSGGIGVQNVGHNHPKVVAAIQNQAARYIHTCFHVVMYEPYIELAERLCALTPGTFDKMAIWFNSGAEAVENAVKVARCYTGRPAVIALEHAFHGRTLLGMSLTSKVKPYKYRFGPFAPEIYRIPAPYCYRCRFGASYPDCGVMCADFLEEFFNDSVASDQTAALIAEPILGEGGFITPPPEYFSKIAKICHECGIVFIADEIQSGMGRTGKMFAIEHYQVVPDLVIVAKSLAAGMPLSGLIGKKEIIDSPHIGGLGSTYGGNPVCISAALAVLDIFKNEHLLGRAIKLGQKVRERFDIWAEHYEIIGQVRGLGPMLALELVQDRKTKKPATDEAKIIVQEAYRRGLILLTCGAFGNVIRALMPLVISDDHLEKGLGIMEEVIHQVNNA
jgi:4-aminobutyrate aminotransferase / (S)-3-amino-2-methylpropionate transaminase / 5-aminovalerate transaminase